MKKRIYRLALTILSCLSMTIQASTNAPAPERVIWDKKPIPVLLAVGQERLIHFPEDIRYWLPDGGETVLQTLSANGVLYLEALEPFAMVRLRIQTVESQQLYLLDVTGTEEGHYRKEMIVLKEEAVINHSKQAPPLTPKGDWMIRLTRFAAQSLYAPERLLPADSAIRRIRVNTDKPVSVVRGGDVEAIPVAAWRGGGLTITAIRLRNTSQRTIVIANRPANTPNTPDTRHVDLRTDLRGDWLTASVQHTVVKAVGSHEDRTCLYLISRQSFEASL